MAETIEATPPTAAQLAKDTTRQNQIGEIPKDDQTAEPVEKAPGDSMVSFDDVEQIDRFKQQEARNKEIDVAKEALVARKAAKAEAKKGTEDGTTSEQTETETTTEAQAETETTEEVIKTFKVKTGDTELDLSADSLHLVTVDGKEAEVSYQDLVNGFSGKEAVKQRFDTLSQQKKQFLRDRGKYNEDKEFFDNRIGNALKLVQSDPIAGLANMASMSGMDEEKFVTEFMSNMAEKFEKYIELSEDERNLQNQTVLNNIRSQKLRTDREQMDRETAKNAQVTRIQNMLSQNNITDDEFRETYFELDQLKKAGKLDEEVTSDFVVDVINNDKIHNKVTDVLTVVRPSLAKNTEVVNDLVEVLSNYGGAAEFTADDLKDIIRQAYPGEDPTESKADSLSKKVAKSAPKSTYSNKTLQPQNEPVSFDELDW